ncbi:MAG: hypothetical protein QW507_00910 [Candidatus Nanoarchaeia archaeon]|nr:hypothetical protein [Candidatus Haiyanarchaeum thermophilum]MCW1303376.1 hypothetical protein [Candidatus Haiyanarchaeum thermophilum]MCW1303937.1 hypothetical protein [Candidatus Haiyanarchaeum thermophilum]MCW1306738.1 hypothetical protein [Candidatus Haiyanarchaeum thermophilum]MCW1308185.1 hypothetical protein [Candidatus Haiyanarchaeum thermophilum]
MNLERKAAISLRKLWQAHDERDEGEGWTAAAELYSILGANSEQAARAGFLTFEAYLLADEAERWQDKDEEMEDFFYHKAMVLLQEARRTCNLETDSPAHTIRWWKAYRHGDERGVWKELIEEHKAVFSHLEEMEEYSRQCVEKLLEAVKKGHDKKDWKVTEEMLEEYFKIFLKAFK